MLNPHSDVVYPVAMVRVNGVKCRAFIDTGAGSRYVSSFLVSVTKAPKITTVRRDIEMLLQTKNTKLDVHQMKLTSLDGEFEMDIDVNKVEKNVLLHVDNPRYGELIPQYPHLNGIKMNDVDTKDQPPEVHLILGVGD